MHSSFTRGTAAIVLLMFFANIVMFLAGFFLALVMEDPEPVKLAGAAAVLCGPVLFLILFVGMQRPLPR